MTGRRLLIAVIGWSVLLASSAKAEEKPVRGLEICVALDAPPEVRQAAQTVLTAVSTQPLLALLAGGQPPVTDLTDTRALLAAPPAERAYHHLIIIGLPTDPAVARVWQREAKVEAGGLFIFGYGHLRGTLGYLESDRNPFLHSREIAAAPFETEIVTITGSDPAGVALAADAFVKEHLVNGVVAAPGWQRPQTSLLDRDPLPAGAAMESALAEKLKNGIALTQASQDEYEGVLADTGVLPLEIWRMKYHEPGAWDGVGVDNAVENYLAGLHRRAYGNTLWCARFSTAADAATAASKIAAAANMQPVAGHWSMPRGEDDTLRPITLWQEQNVVFMSTLPEAQTAKLLPSAR